MQAKRILNHFQSFAGSEFRVPGESRPFCGLKSKPKSRTIFSSKPNFAADFLPGNVSLVGGYGICNCDEINLLRAISSDSRLYFLGDCDPVDILLFHWLQQHIKIEFLGVSEEMIGRLETDSENATMNMSSEELDSLEFVREISPNLHSMIGLKLDSLWRNGRKIEMEGAFNLTKLSQTQRRSVLEAMLKNAE